MNPRYTALESQSRFIPGEKESTYSTSYLQSFGIHVFDSAVMQKMLPKEINTNLLAAMRGKEQLNSSYADTIAVAMKEWATSYGATHYTHWFLPMTGLSAEKHDSFLDWKGSGQVIEAFNGKQLLQGEPDASSFPSGGLRSTYEARGYTGWDPSSPPFLWKGGGGLVLCIPSIFFSWNGEPLDFRIPLLRSEKKINDAVLRLLKITGIEASHIYTTLGIEQEYFIIDRALRNLRTDLVLTGKTLFGAPSPKGQELQDHYFGVVKDRVLAFMRDFEDSALQLAIPVKTRHNEVAPAQHEIAPIFEKASIAVDHNILLMELMRQTAARHGLSCLLHEKPFHDINGSGKHCNWSLSTDTGLNLLDPTESPENNLHFLVLVTAILHAVHRHSLLLRASIGSASNDYRLGGHEAPPAIISVYLGDLLESILSCLEEKGAFTGSKTKHRYDFGLPVFPDMTKDYSDRNRTSPFAFTGTKFEFRAVGSSSNVAMPITVLNTIVAESLNAIMDKIEEAIRNKPKSNPKEVLDAAIPVIKEFLIKSKKIRFSGDNYSLEWQKEAKRRGIPNFAKSVDAFEAFISPHTQKAFESILKPHELQSYYDIQCEHYFHTLNIEIKVALDMFKTQILPAALKQQKLQAKSLKLFNEVSPSKPAGQLRLLKDLNHSIEKAIKCADELDELRQKAAKGPSAAEKGKLFCKLVMPKYEELRAQADHLETLIEDELWPFPKYRELLFMV